MTNVQPSDVGYLSLSVDSRIVPMVVTTLVQSAGGASADLSADVAVAGPFPTSAS